LKTLESFNYETIYLTIPYLLTNFKIRNMTRKLLSLVSLFLIISAKLINAQGITTDVKETAASKMASEIHAKIKSYGDVNIVVLPFYDEKGNKTEHSDDIGKHVAQQLNLLCGKKNTVWYYTAFENEELAEQVNNTDFGERNSTYYTNLLEKFKPDFVVAGSYSINYNQKKFYLTNVNLYKNWTDGEKEMTIKSADNVAVDIEMPSTTEYLWRSAVVPGWGQIHKQQKGKGTLFMVSSIGLIAFGITSQTLYSINHLNYSKALQSGDNSNADIYEYNRDAWGMIRNVDFIAFAGIYAFNIIDAITSKNKKLYSHHNVNIYPYYAQNSYNVGISIKLGTSYLKKISSLE